jgi:predicted nucleic acid-binding protein
MYYIDSNIIIFHFVKDRVMGRKCKRLLERVSSGEIEVVSSVHLLNEVYATIRMVTGNENKAMKLALKTLEFGIKFHDLSLETFADVLEVSKKFRLKWGDCIHYLTMKRLNVKRIISDDTDFDRTEGIERIDLRRIEPESL